MSGQGKNPLSKLLRQADAAADSPPSLRGDLTSQVIARSRRQKRIRIGTGVIGTAAVTAIGLVMMLTPDVDTPGHRQGPPEKVTFVDPSEKIAALNARLDQLEAEIRSREAVVERMVQLESMWRHCSTLHNDLASITAEEEIKRCVEDVAVIILFTIEQERIHGGEMSEAADAYREVIRLFPQTHSAQTARVKLNEIEKL